MHPRVVLPVIIIIISFAVCGCTGYQSTFPPGGVSAPGTATVQTGEALVPGPTDAVPDYNAVTVDVGEKDYLGNIPVIFQGGKGQIHVKKIDVKLIRADGQIQTENLGRNKGDDVELQGTKQTDRVEVTVTMDNGQTYKIVDTLRAYRTRG